jgi:Rps23 Pro-64 3,4-dihydroxylase Tpa1-like proline 4-hydroxylase
MGRGSPTEPRLAAWIDPAKLAPSFARSGRLHLPDFFEAGFASALGTALAEATPWSRSMMIGAAAYDAPTDALAEISEAERRQVEAALAQGARSGFQYDFDSWRLSDRIEAGDRAGAALGPVEAAYDFLNGASFLTFVRRLTGDARAAYCDAQATRYRAGHFLNTHDDAVDGKHRLFAYVIGMTPEWSTDWGGLLLFHDADGHVGEGFAPRFNALNIFRVPQAHSVSQVAGFVTASRLSITGWIRTSAAKPSPAG